VKVTWEDIRVLRQFALASYSNETESIEVYKSDCDHLQDLAERIELHLRRTGE
jgi:hypothetical protein